MNRACWDLCGGRPAMGVPTAILDSLPTNAFITRVRALHTRSSRTSARCLRYFSLRALACRVVGLAGRTGRGRPAPRQAQTVLRTVCVRARPCQRTKLQPTRARPTAVSRMTGLQRLDLVPKPNTRLMLSPMPAVADLLWPPGARASRRLLRPPAHCRRAAQLTGATAWQCWVSRLENWPQ